MALFTLMSAGGSPGVTTTALAVTYAWGGRALLAECDPKGGDVLSGFLSGRVEAERAGLLNFALSLAHSPDPEQLWNFVASLDSDAGNWLLLPGLRDPREAGQLEGVWGQIAHVFEQGTSKRVDVVADVGRIGGPDTPLSLIAQSDLAMLLLRPTLRQIAAAKPRLDALGRHVGGDVPVALCLVGRGEYAARDVSDALFGLPVLAEIPHDPRSAELLSDGRPSTRAAKRCLLMNGAAALAVAMQARVEHDSDEGRVVAAAGWGHR